MLKECPTCHAGHERRSKYCCLKCSDRAWQLRRKYGITPDVVFTLYKKQNGRCAICGEEGDVRELGFVKKQALCVDHDHDTGKIRGLLCNPCNLGIGKLQDSPRVIRGALQYLKKHKRKEYGKRTRSRKVRGRTKQTYLTGRK